MLIYNNDLPNPFSLEEKNNILKIVPKEFPTELIKPRVGSISMLLSNSKSFYFSNFLLFISHNVLLFKNYLLQTVINITSNPQIKKQKGEIEKQKGEIEKQKGEIKKQKGEIEKQEGEIEKQKGEIEKQKGEIKKQEGEIEK